MHINQLKISPKWAKCLRWLAYTIGALLVGVIIFLSVLFNSHSIQLRIAQTFIPLLEERLNAKITLKDIDYASFKGMFELYGLTVNDQHEQVLLQIDTLQIRFGISQLLQKQLLVKSANLHGVSTHLYRDQDSIANYQFILDALKSQPKDTTQTKKKGQPLDFDFDHLSIRRLQASWQPGGEKASMDVRLTQLTAEWPYSAIQVELDSLFLKTDSPKPRKNAEKPNRGAFDANHLDAVVSAKLDILLPRMDSLEVSVKQLFAADRSSGLRLDSIQAQATVSPGQIQLDNVRIRSNQTIIRIPEALLQTKPFVIHPLRLNAEVSLQDIAQPFAPPLSNFTTPLLLNTQVSGTIDSIAFDSIHIQTPDERLNIQAQGNMTKVTKKHELELFFTIHKMAAQNNVHTEIVNHFSKKVNLKMTEQLNTLKNIQYQGSLHIYYKHVAMQGLLTTPYGGVDFNFDLDSNTHFMTGNLRTGGLNLGKIMDIKGLNKVEAQANVHINIANPRKRPVTSGERGLLPIGTLTALIPNAHYQNFHLRIIKATMNSDGKVATGKIDVPGHIAMGGDFTYTYTNREKKLQVKPRLKINRISKKKSKSKRD